MRKISAFTALLLLFVISTSFYQEQAPSTPTPNLEAERWVENIYNQMSEDERIGQLMMIRAHSDKGEKHIAHVRKMISDFHVGGLCFFQGTPEKQAQLTNEYQRMTKRIPMLISMDAEWGLGMRLKKTAISYPKQLMLGAIQDNRLIYDMGAQIAEECRRLGVHMNFAPVADVNNNPDNPVINTRSFGEDIYNVAVKSYMYMRGMQDNGVIACAKHFPGHGDTDVDSHYDLPVISHDLRRLDSLEFFPFQVMVEKGIQSVMVAHLHIPAIDATTNMPTTLSPKAVNKLLKKEMGFTGLIVTDGLGMKGVTKHYNPGEVEAKALVAGNDILLLPENVPAAFKAIKEYMADGRLPQQRIEESVKKILLAKYKLGLREISKPYIPLNNLRASINTPEGLALKARLIEHSLILARNDDNILPITELQGKNYASISIGSERQTDFQKGLKKYATLPDYQMSKNITRDMRANMIAKVKDKDAVIVSLHSTSNYASKDFGVTPSMRTFLEALQRETKVILVSFGSPYSLKYFDNMRNIVVAFTEDEMVQEVTAQGIFGAFPLQGRMPVTASPKAIYGQGISTNSLFRMGYGLPESVGISADKLKQIDTLMQDGIASKSTPGGVVLVAKNGKIVFNKAYGYHTYDQRLTTSKSDVYDLASVTKIAATTLSIMKLYDNGVINLHEPIKTYLPELDTTNKANLTILDMLTHHARLRPWIPFYQETVSKPKRKRDKPNPLPQYYNRYQQVPFVVPVTEKLFMKDTYVDTIWQNIYNSDLRSAASYKYSDLGFLLLARIVERMSGMPLDRYASQNFYEPLGLRTTTFKPTEKMSRSVIPPTENDDYFRRHQVHGYVHDMGAAMLGGVAGHAGLFSNSEDLAIIMQMLLNKGYYGGRRYFKPETVRLFTTRCENCTRRGLGFDMRQLNSKYQANMGTLASDSTFGHLGFTGTCVWTDPQSNLIVVVLANRTFPKMKPNKWARYNYRPRLQDAVYQALEYKYEVVKPLPISLEEVRLEK